MRCPRLYRYRYIDNKTNTGSNDILTFGQEFHEGLEQFWHGKRQYQIPYDAFSDTDQALICDALLTSYLDRYSLDEVELLECEVKHEIEMNGVTRVVIFDAVIKYRGRTLLVESKTTRSYIDEKSWYWNRLDLDVQTGLYVWAARELGYAVDGVLYDVSRVPKLKKGKVGRKEIFGETDEQFYDRVLATIYKDQDKYHVRKLFNPDVDEVMLQVKMWEDMLKLSDERGEFPKNHNSCQMYGRTCEFKPVCTGDTTLDNERLYTIRKKKETNATT